MPPPNICKSERINLFLILSKTFSIIILTLPLEIFYHAQNFIIYKCCRNVLANMLCECVESMNKLVIYLGLNYMKSSPVENLS